MPRLDAKLESLRLTAAGGASVDLDAVAAGAPVVLALLEAEQEAARIVAAAEEKKSQADEMVAAAARVQAQVLGSLESARATLGITSDVPANADVHPIESNAAAQPERTAEPQADDVRDATDAAA